MFYFILLLCFLSQSVHTEVEPNSFLDWAKQYAQDARQEGGWVCGLWPASHTPGFPWWVSPLQGSDWSRLQCYIHEEQAASKLLRTATFSDVSQWPIYLTLQGNGHGKCFSKNVSDAITEKFSESFLSQDRILPVPIDKSHRYKDGHFQVWDEYLWLTPSMGRLSQAAPLCWEQHKHSRSAWPNTSKFLGWIPSDQCQHTISLKRTDWFATEWASRPDVRWAAPNGTQWLCGTNLWPWLPPGWVGRCTLGFPWMQGRWVGTLDQPGNLSVLQNTTTPDELQPRNGLSSPPAHSVGLRDVVLQAESLAHYLDKALNDTTFDISLSNFEAQLLRKAELQHQMAQDSMTAAAGGSCAVLPGECCVFIPKCSGLEHVSPGPPRFAGSIWAFLCKIPGWKWLIALTGVAVILLVFGPCLVERILNFLFFNLQSFPLLRRILLSIYRAMYIEPPAIAPGLEGQKKIGPKLLPLDAHTQQEAARMTLRPKFF